MGGTVAPVIFRKPTFNSLFDPFGSPSRGQKPQGREDVTALRCSEPLRNNVGGPKRSSPCCAGWERMDASGNIFYVLDFGGVSEKSGVLRHIDVYKGGDVCDI